MFEAPYPPYDPTDKSGFSYQTVVKRWPIILTQIIDQLHRSNHELFLQSQSGSSVSAKINAKIWEGNGIIEKISKLKYQMGRDYQLEPIVVDDEAHVDTYNSELARLAQSGKNTWFTAPWLFSECYLYRLIRSYFSQTKHWSQYDPFLARKTESFRNSGASVYRGIGIATMMHGLDKSDLESNPNQIGVLMKEMIQMCLWGNATDLSLLTHLTPSDISHLQCVGKEAQEDREKFILKDDQEMVWEHMKSMKSKRVDYVLDNAGFELFTDLVFSDFLVTYTPYVSQVVFHPKLIPWFVSDVTPLDFTTTINSLLDTSFFIQPSPTDQHHLERMVSRWKQYITDGIFSLSIPAQTPLGGMGKDSGLANFWTTPWPYWDMQSQAEDLWRWLQESGLVIFKGDLNYRKLTGDIQWPASTPFHSALGPLAGSFPMLSLRTNKADVVVGIKKEIADLLDQSEQKWRIDGRYALISFLP